jgi:hypothetical protein
MIAVLVTVVWAAATFTFNSIAGTDYGFLNGKPHTASLLEVLGRPRRTSSTTARWPGLAAATTYPTGPTTPSCPSRNDAN